MLVAAFFRFYRLVGHPPGIFFDPAFNGLDAIRLLQRGGPVIFLPTNGGREALFIYLLIPFIRLFGPTPFSMRLLTTAAGLLTVALLLAFLNDARAAKRSPGGAQSWFAALSGLVLAVLYWHITTGRLGQRPILVPMLAVPLFWFFLKGWATGRKRWFILSGLVMGLEGYTYSAARLLPVILVLAVIPEFLLAQTRRQALARLKGLALFLLTAALVYLPMAGYLVTHPAQFTARAFSVMVWNFLDTPAAILAELGRNLGRVAGFFCCAGSPNPIFGLPGYPGLSPLLAPFLLTGLAAAIRRPRNLFNRLVAIWWLAGIFPSIIAIEAPHPLRMIVAVVPTAVLAAHGLTLAVAWLQPRVARFAPRRALWALAVVLVLAPAPGIFRAYFVRWTALQTTRGVYDYGAVALKNKILTLTGNGAAVYLPLTRFNNPPLLYYLSAAFERQAAAAVVPVGRAMVVAPDDNAADSTWVRLHNGAATILPPLAPQGRQIIQTALAANNTRAVRTGDGELVARVAPLPTDPARFVQQPATFPAVSFGPVSLTGAVYSPVVAPPTGPVTVTLYWQANRSMTTEYEILVRLVDDHRQSWGNGDARPTDWVYPTSFWRPQTDQVAFEHQVMLTSPGPPPGRYWLAISVFDPPNNRRLPLASGHSSSPNTYLLGPLKVPLPPAPPLPPPANGPVTFGDVAVLSGLEPDRFSVAAGEPVQFTLQWEALHPTDIDYTIFTHLLDAAGNVAAGYDNQPVNNSYPTGIWSAGEIITDPHSLPTPAGLPPGQYRLAIGLYHQPTGRRLPVYRPNGVENKDGRYILAQTVTITGDR